MALSISISSEADLRAIERARRSLDQFADNADTNANRLRNFGSGLQNVGKRLTMFSAAAAAGLGVFAKGAIDAAQEAEVASNRLDAIAKSMGFLGPVLGGTTNRLQDFASSLQSTIAVEDETIMATQSLLLTFSEVGKTAGEAGGAFDRATKAAFDLSAAGFGSADSAAKMLGKALQDPIKGITALSRAGVTFTAAQKEQIQGFIDSGQAAKAQEMILREVERQVSGTAAATATGGAKMKIAFGEVQEQIGTALLPLFQQFTQFMLDRGIPAIQGLVDKFLALSPQMKGVIAAAGGLLLALGPLLMVAGTLVKALAGLGPAFAVVKAGLLGVGPLMAALGAAAGPVLLVVGAVVALGAGFVALYRYSEPVRDSVTLLVSQFRLMAQTVGVALVDAFRSILGGSNGVRSFGDVMRDLGDRVAPVVTRAIKFLASGMDDLGVAIRFQIRVFEVLVTVFTMVANIIRVVLFEAVELVIDSFKQMILNVDNLLKKMGPFGEFLRTFAINMVASFRAAAGAIQGIFNNLGSYLESAINVAIRGINLLVDGYNKIPGVMQVPRIDEFRFAVTQLGVATANAAGAAGVYVRANEHMNRGINSTATIASAAAEVLNTGLKPALDSTGSSVKKAGDASQAAAEKLAAFKARLQELRSDLDAAIRSAADYAASIRDRFVGALDLGKALDTAKETGGSIVDAFIEQGKRMAAFTARMQELLNAGLSRPAFDAIINAGAERGADIADALAKGNIAENVANVNAVYASVADMGEFIGSRGSLLFNQQGITMAASMLEAFIKEFMPSGKRRRQLLDAIEDMVGSALSSLARIPRSISMPSVIGGVDLRPPGGGDATPGPGPTMPTGPIPGGSGFTYEDIYGPGGIVPLAKGGIAKMGRPFLVGERGPELFVPGVTGTVIPNDQLTMGAGAGGDVIYQIMVNAGMGTDGASVGRQIVDAIRKFERFSGPVFQAA